MLCAVACTCSASFPRSAYMHMSHQRGTARRRALGDGAQVHEVAVAAARARVFLVLPAGGLAEIGHRAELYQDGPPRVEAPRQALQRARRRILVRELRPSATLLRVLGLSVVCAAALARHSECLPSPMAPKAVLPPRELLQRQIPRNTLSCSQCEGRSWQ